jgi:hypothetical protein
MRSSWTGSGPWMRGCSARGAWGSGSRSQGRRVPLLGIVERIHGAPLRMHTQGKDPRRSPPGPRIWELLFSAAAMLGSIACDQPEIGNREAAPQDTGAPRWALSPTPDTVFSSVASGSDSIPLFGIAGARMTDHGMVVAITGARSHSLLFLDESARLIRSYGRFGRGPGEFARITALFRHDHEVAVWDFQNRRMSLLATDGQYLRSVTLPVNPSDQMVGVFPDGSVVTTSSSGSAVRGTARVYAIRDAGGVLLDSLAGPTESADGQISIHYTIDGRPSVTSTSLTPECLPRLLHVIVGDRLFIGDSGRGTVLAVERDGTTKPVFRSAARESLTKEVLAEVRRHIELLQERLRSGPVMAPDGFRRLTGVRFPRGVTDSVLVLLGRPGDPLPSTWGEMRADGAGRLWLRRAACYRAREADVWVVVDTAGRLLAKALIPPGSPLLDIGISHVLVAYEDSLGIEYLAKHEILR